MTIDLKILDGLEKARRILIDRLSPHKATCEVTFSGSGDSGSLDEPVFDVPSKTDEERDLVERALGCDKELNAAATELADYFLSVQGLDWYNDSGGEGEITIDHEGNVDVTTRITTTDYDTHEDSYDMTDHLIRLKLGVSGEGKP